jgi:hypothetical protein
MDSKPDVGLETLLLLDGEIYDQGGGHWISIRAWPVPVSRHIPHGIRYSLTLHNRYGTRLMGYDNSHGVRPPGRARFTGRRVMYDHRHRHSRCCGVPYEFTSADQLLADFFDEVDRFLKQARP